MKRSLLILTLLSITLILLSQEKMNTGIIYGRNCVFMLGAPDGWVLDNKSGVNQGLYAVFYRNGESWKDAKTVMYTNIASFIGTPDSTLDLLIKYDHSNFKKNYSDILITDEKDIAINDKLAAKISYLSGKSYGNFEAIAYINTPKSCVMIVLSSRTKQDFNNSISAFEKLLKSYTFIGDKVTIEKNQ
jgi:hypothetical protein